MIQIIMKPDYDAKSVDGENLYKCLFNGEDVGLRVRGRKAAHAEEKMMEIFRSQLKGKEVDYDLEEYRKKKSEGGCAQAGDSGEAGEPDGKEAEQVVKKKWEEQMLPGIS